MKFTRIPENTFKEIQLNAGVLLDTFNPASPGTPSSLLSHIKAATSGGVNFTATPNYEDFGADVDNCPENTKELKKLKDWTVKMSGNFITVKAATVADLVGVASVSGTKITPLADLQTSHFKELWWVGDYSDKNGDSNGGFIAIRMLNTLSTGGFQLQSGNKAKGQFSFEFMAHYSTAQQSVVPFEVYVVDGTAESGSFDMTVTSAAGTSGKTAITVSETKTSTESYVYQTGHSLITPSLGTILDGSAWSSWDGTAQITASSGMDIIVAIVDSTTKAAQHAGKTTVVAGE